MRKGSNMSCNLFCPEVESHIRKSAFKSNKLIEYRAISAPYA